MPEGPGKAPERVGRVPRLVELLSGRPRDAPRTPGRLWGLARQGSLGGRERGDCLKAKKLFYTQHTGGKGVAQWIYTPGWAEIPNRYATMTWSGK